MKPSRPWIASIIVLAFFASSLLEVSFASHRTSELAGPQLLTTPAKEPAGSNRHHSRRGAATPDFAAAKARPRASQTPLPSSYGKLPLSFEANEGQTAPEVNFLARGAGYTVFLTPSREVLSLKRAIPTQKEANFIDSKPAREYSQTVLQLRLLDSNTQAKVSGVDRLPGISNYFIGNDPAQWHTGIPNYGKVLYRDIYPGVDVAYYGHEGQLESDFIVAPRANAKKIRFGVEGAAGLRVSDDGDLILRLDGGEVRLQKPAAYQVVNGTRREVRDGYKLLAKNEVGFWLGSYDHSQKLVIDPAFFFSTYLGGSGQDKALAVATDGVGDTFVTGQTTSTNFPIGISPVVLQSSLGGIQNAFVTEYPPDGLSFVYCTYLGGNGTDSGNAIAVDNLGNAYIGGQTTSSNFPTKNPLAGQGQLNGSQGAFVSQISATGAALLFSTYLSGNGSDAAGGIGLDSSLNVYIAGATSSTNFPTVLAFQGGLNGVENGFIAKLAAPSASGSNIIYSSYLGGNGFDQAHAIAVDAGGDAFLTGQTNSTVFPTVAPFQANLGAPSATNAWVAEVKVVGGSPQVQFATYLGGTVFDQAFGIAVDTSGDVYVDGITQSPDFPLQNALQAFGGTQDAFVTKFAPGGGSLLFSTYFGGSNFTFANAIALDSSNNVYFTGSTFALDYPTRNPLEATLGNFGGDAVVTELATDGSAILFSSYLGGSASVPGAGFPADSGGGIAVDVNGSIYVAGAGGTLDFTTLNPEQPVLASQSSNAFVAKIGIGSANTTLAPAGLNFGSSVVNVAAPTQRMTLQDGAANLGITSITLSGANPGDFSEFDTCGQSLPIGVVCEITIGFTPLAAGSRSAVGTIATSSGNINFNVSGTGVAATPPGTVTVSPGSLTFASQEVGTPSPAQFVNITNTGATPVSLQNSVVIGVDRFDFPNFIQSSAGCPNPGLIQPGATCQVNVDFDPTAPGARSATLQISGNFTTSPQTVSLSGTATAQQASLNPTSLTFAGTQVGTTSAPQTVTLTNTSTTQNLTSIQVGAPSANFNLATNTCPAVLAPSGSCTFSVTFTPASAGNTGGSLQVTDSDPAQQSVFLSGLGLNPTATLQVPIQTQFFFGRMTIGSSATLGVDLVNIGNTGLTFTLQPGGANPGDFTATPTITSTCTGASPFTITPGGNCFVTLTFTPTVAGARLATVTVSSTATNTPQTLNLSGTGEAATTVNFLPSTLLFPATGVGSSSADEFAILANIGTVGDVLRFAFIGGANPGDFQIDFSFSGPFQSNCEFSSVLNAEATCYIPVKFTPTILGLRTATLTINDTATGNPHSIALQGGQASGPAVQLSTAALAFASQTVGTTSAEQTVTVTNIGNANLNFAGLTITGDFQCFAQTAGCAIPNQVTANPPCAAASPLAPSASCDISVDFTPTATGTRSGTLSIADNAANTPQAVNLTGTGTSSSGGLTISPTALPNGNIGGAYGQTLTVTGGVQPFTFSVSTGTLPAGLNLGATSGSIGGVPTGPIGASTFTVTVTDSSAPQQTGNATYTITINAADASNNAELNGHYAALSSGFEDSTGTMRVSVASFTADGNGNITNGINDTNDVSGAQASVAFTGTYTLGADNRGTITLSEVGVGGPPLTIAFAVGEIQGGIATKARFIRFDDVSGTGKRESGVLLRQDPTAFNLASVKGNYAFGDSGSKTSNGAPHSDVGFVTADGNGNFTTGLIDTDSGGGTNSSAISGTYTAPSASNGRFTSTLTVAGLGGAITETLYVVSANQVIYISINSAGTTVTSGTAQLQVPPAGGFSLGSLSGNSVFSVQGLQAGASSNVHIGALSPDGNGNFTAAFDGNESGTSSSGTATGTYTVAANGRSVLTFTTVTGGGGGGIQPAIVYLDGPNQGFVGFTDGSASEGIIEPGGSGFTNATLSGNYFVGTLGPTENQVNDFSGVASFDGIGTALQVTLDQSKPGGILQADQTLSTSYAVAANGRFTFTDESGETIVGYVASGCKAEVISSTGSNPGIIPFECQVTPVSGPVAQLSTAALTFGAQVTGTTSAEQQVTVTNVGGSALNFTGFTATGDFACFAQGQSCALPNQQTANPPCSTATPLAPSASCDISVAFTPSATGTRNGTLSIADNATGSPQTVALTGTGVNGQFTVAPASLNFGTVVINTTSPAQIVTVTNGTTNPVVINSITVPAAFAETDNCVTGDGPPLASGASCTINVTFTPTSASTFSGNLTIFDSISAPPPTVALTGNGTISTFTLALAPGSSSSVTVVPGGTAAYGILVTGTPGINQTINFTASTTSNTITVIVTPQSVTITGTGNTQFALVLQTFCRKGGIGPNPQVPGGGLKVLLFAMALAAMAWVYRRRPRWALSFALLMLIAIGGAACGGDPGANGPTPPGTYPVTLTATSGQQVQTLNLTLIVQ